MDRDRYPAASFCRILGRELLRLESPTGLDQVELDTRARARGFEVASKGEASIIAALTKLMQFGISHNLEIGGALGDLFYRKGANASFDLECFAPFRRILHSFVVENWPIGKGEFVYGAPLPERILHSVRTAAMETGVRPDLLRSLLAEIGAIDPKDEGPDAWKTFSAKEYAPFLSDLQTWVGPLEIRKAMGATRREFYTLVEDLVLRPCTHLPKVKKIWRLADGLDLVASLTATALVIGEEDDNWEKLQDAKTRSGVPVGVLIAAIRSGDLQVGSRNGQVDYESICVCKQEVNQLATPTGAPQPEDCLAASSFERSIGLRTKGRFLALVRKGHTPATRMRHPNTGIWQYFMTEGNIAAFHQRFMTLKSMADEFGRHRRTYLTALQSANVAAFAPEGEDYGHLYLREDVEPVLRRHHLID